MKTLCFFVLLLAAFATHAQDCGGMASAGGTCVPPDVAMPSYQQQQAPPRSLGIWVDQWGAIATSNAAGGVLGTSTNMPSKDAAKQSAMADCQAKGGRSNCELELAYENGCAVLLVGDKFFNASSDATLAKATKLGMKTCMKNGNTNCHVYYSACSLPFLLQ